MDIDEEIKSLIADIYRNISELKRLLGEIPFTNLKNFIECGNALNKMMDETLEVSSVKPVVQNLSEIIWDVYSAITFISADHNLTIQNKPELSACLETILDGLQKLRYKISHQA